MAHLFAVAESGTVDPWLLHVARWTERFCWAVFVIVWGISWASQAFSGKKPVKRSQSIATRFWQLPFYVAGVLLLFFSKVIPVRALDFRLLPRSDGLTGAAMVLTVVGIATAIWARATLADNWSARATLKEGHELIQTGPYRFVRHPIYTGLLLAFLGTALMRCSPRSFSGVLVFLAVFVWKIRIEERFLSAEFGARYEEYRRRVKALVPFVV